jgi:hypothetical protein
VGVAQRRGLRGSVKGLRRGSASTALGVASCGAARRGDAELEELSRRPAEGDAELEELSRARRQCHTLVCLLKKWWTRRGDAELEELSRRPASSDAELGELRRVARTSRNTRTHKAHTRTNSTQLKQTTHTRTQSTLKANNAHTTHT